MVWLWVWGIVTAASLVIEFLISNLITIWFAAGGFITLFIVALVPGLNIIWQLLVFIGIVAILLLFVRRLCLNVLNKNKGQNNSNN